MYFKRLKRNFFARDTHVVAKSLLGKMLMRCHTGENFLGSAMGLLKMGNRIFLGNFFTQNGIVGKFGILF